MFFPAAVKYPSSSWYQAAPTPGVLASDDDRHRFALGPALVLQAAFRFSDGATLGQVRVVG